MKELHILSTTCRRFRRILLPKIYHTVNLQQCNNEPRLHFLSLTPSYGHLCRDLALRIAGIGSNFRTVVKTLREQCKHLTNLRSLDLDIRLLDGIKCPGKSLDSNVMSATDLRYWKDLCATIPHVTELHLNSLTLSDAAKGFAKADLSSVRTLSLRLPAPVFTMISSRSLNRAFTGLVNILLPHQWCPDPDWIRQAFANRDLQSVTIESTGAFGHRHVCTSGRCNWAASITLLVELNSTSLTSLTIGTRMCLMLSLEQISFPSLTTLRLHHYPFRKDTFDNFMKPFLRCPLQHLSLDDCEGVPESFCIWFDPNTASEIWPDLRSLSLSNLKTCSGPGDKQWDEMKPNQRNTWETMANSIPELYWRSHPRLVLQDHCVRRGIFFDSRSWKWFTGFHWREGSTQWGQAQ